MFSPIITVAWALPRGPAEGLIATGEWVKDGTVSVHNANKENVYEKSTACSCFSRVNNLRISSPSLRSRALLFGLLGLFLVLSLLKQT